LRFYTLSGFPWRQRGNNGNSAAMIPEWIGKNYQRKITSDNPDQCGGRPCIRGMRMRVIDVLDLLAAGLNAEQILEELPDLEMDDVKAALNYAARRLDHPVMVA
jgi:uncharacterized protein (DUF433 family)